MPDPTAELSAELRTVRARRERAERLAAGTPVLQRALLRAHQDKDSNTSSTIEDLQQRVDDAHQRLADHLLHLEKIAGNIRRLTARAEPTTLTANERTAALDAVAEAAATLDIADIAHTIHSASPGSTPGSTPDSTQGSTQGSTRVAAGRPTRGSCEDPLDG